MKSFRAILLFVFFLFFMEAVNAGAAIRYVSATYGSDKIGYYQDNDGTDPAYPCKTITHTLAVSSSGDTIRLDLSDFAENITLSTFSKLTLEGGWNSKFTTRFIHKEYQKSMLWPNGNHVIAIIADGISVNIQISGFIITGGNANQGGGVYILAQNGGNASVGIQDCKIVNNTTTSASGPCGGGVYAYSSFSSLYVSLKENIIMDNYAYTNGGGVAITGYGGNVTASLVNNVIAENEAGNWGGGIYFYESENSMYATLVNNTITSNTAGTGQFPAGGQGSGLVASSYYNGSATIDISNSIVWGGHGKNDILIYEIGPSETKVNAAYSDIGKVYIWNPNSESSGTYNDYGGNINADPFFINSQAGNFHLTSKSPCIDGGTNFKGLPTYDFEGDPRIIYGKYDGTMEPDMGADEYVRLPVFQGHDFDGDWRSDISLWRPSTGMWYIRDPYIRVAQWGEAGDVPVSGDYNGDYRTDIAVWRPSTGMWYIRDPYIRVVQWGEAADIPVPGDYNGDNINDIAVWRPSTGMWYIRDPYIRVIQWGEAGDIPVPADYNGDGITDIAVWRPSTGMWYIRDPYIRVVQWGEAGDIPVPGDYNGDNINDIAVWRPSTGMWYVLEPSIRIARWGEVGDIPVPGDYNGDNKTDIAVWRPATGMWYILEPSIRVEQWGAVTDIPLVR